MKKYSSIGELLIDYRTLNNISQIELASKFDLDIRTIQRWEKNITLLKADKEEEMVDITFIPYQVIRNLNAPVSIPTFYDFNTRKYSLSVIAQELPNPNWIKSKMNNTTERLRTISHNSDIDDIIRCSLIQKHISKPIRKELILKACFLTAESVSNSPFFGIIVVYPVTQILDPSQREILVGKQYPAKGELCKGLFLFSQKIQGFLHSKFLLRKSIFRKGRQRPFVTGNPFLPLFFAELYAKIPDAQHLG